MDGTATISLDTLDELREKAEEARLATNRSKRFTSKLMDCYEFDTEKYNKALEERAFRHCESNPERTETDPGSIERTVKWREKMEKTCKTCIENDCGLCDRTGRLVEDDDQCEKWVSNQPEWKTKMMQTFLAGH